MVVPRRRKSVGLYIALGVVLISVSLLLYAGWVANYRGVAMLVFLYVCLKTFTSREKAADNPWGVGATTLEWTLSSPPPFHQFEVLPQVR